MSPNNLVVRVISSGELPDGRIVVPAHLRDLTRASDQYRLCAGSAEHDVAIQSFSDTGQIVLPSSLARNIGVPGSATTGILAGPSSLRLGPLVGVFVSSGLIKGLQSGNPHLRIHALLKANQDVHAILFFFSLDDISWNTRTITGCHYREDNSSWTIQRFPFPDVIYDRAGFPPHLQSAANKARLQFRQHNIPSVNALARFDKWELHQELSRFPSVQPYLLHTVLCRSATDISEMLAAHGTVYLKQLDGNNGRQVLRVAKRENAYAISYFKKGVVNLTLREWVNASAHIDRFFGGNPFVIQEGVTDLTYDGGPVDIRALVQKGGTGVWAVTALPVRFGHRDCAITSTQSGSAVYGFDQAFSMLGFGSYETGLLHDRIHEMVITIADALEQAFGPFGEVGIDIAIRPGLLPRLIECNARPAKDTVVIGQPELTREAFARPLRYAGYLAGFHSDQ